MCILDGASIGGGSHLKKKGGRRKTETDRRRRREADIQGEREEEGGRERKREGEREGKEKEEARKNNNDSGYRFKTMTKICEVVSQNYLRYGRVGVLPGLHVRRDTERVSVICTARSLLSTQLAGGVNIGRSIDTASWYAHGELTLCHYPVATFSQTTICCIKTNQQVIC